MYSVTVTTFSYMMPVPSYRSRHTDRLNMPSGVAGPLAALGGGQICRPFVLGF